MLQGKWSEYVFVAGEVRIRVCRRTGYRGAKASVQYNGRLLQRVRATGFARVAVQNHVMEGFESASPGAQHAHKNPLQPTNTSTCNNNTAPPLRTDFDDPKDSGG